MHIDQTWELRQSLCNDGWRTPDCYVSRWHSKIPTKSGIYLFLHIKMEDGPPRIFEEKILYVGMARDIKARLCGHEIPRLFPDLFYEVWFKEFEGVERQRRNLERIYIQKFNPPYNIIGRKRGCAT